MRCLQAAIIAFLLLSSCQAVCTAGTQLYPRGSPRRGSKSPSPSSSGGSKSPPRTTRLFGVTISQPRKRPASTQTHSGQSSRPPNSAGHPSQSADAHSAHLSRKFASVGHPTTSTHAHPVQSGPSTHGTPPRQTIRPVRGGAVRQTRARGKNTEMYTQWVNNLRGPLARQRVGRTALTQEDAHSHVKYTPVPKKPRLPVGVGPRYEAQKRYRERQKQKKEAERAGKHPFSGHHEHPPPKGGGGGGPPGSPGAAGQAVGRRQTGS